MRRVRPLNAQGGKCLLMREQVLAIAAAAFVQQGLGQPPRIQHAIESPQLVEQRQGVVVGGVASGERGVKFLRSSGAQGFDLAHERWQVGTGGSVGLHALGCYSVAGCRFWLEAKHDGAAVRLAVAALLLAAQQVHQRAARHLVLAGQFGHGHAVGHKPLVGRLGRLRVRHTRGQRAGDGAFHGVFCVW